MVEYLCYDVLRPAHERITLFDVSCFYYSRIMDIQIFTVSISAERVIDEGESEDR